MGPSKFQIGVEGFDNVGKNMSRINICSFSVAHKVGHKLTSHLLAILILKYHSTAAMGNTHSEAQRLNTVSTDMPENGFILF